MSTLKRKTASGWQYIQLAGEDVLDLNAELNIHKAETTPHSGATPEFNGIVFPATQVPSAGANTLDDYEEGTWTPVFSRQYGTTDISATVTSATYTKIGRKVTINLHAQITAITSQGTGYTQINGLPYASSAKCVGVVGYNTAFTTVVVNAADTAATDSSIFFLENNNSDELLSVAWKTGYLTLTITYVA